MSNRVSQPRFKIHFCFLSGWRPKGLLVAHLHEHRSAVNRIRVSDEHLLFATCSNDGTVKIWNSQKMEGKTTTTRLVLMEGFLCSRAAQEQGIPRAM